MVGIPIVDSAGSDGAAQSPGRAPLNSVKSAMAGVGGTIGAGLRPAACAIKAAHSAHAPATRWIAREDWRGDGRVGVMRVWPSMKDLGARRCGMEDPVRGAEAGGHSAAVAAVVWTR
jgi:hypothetical protein